MRTRTALVAVKTCAFLQFTADTATIVLPENIAEASEAQLRTVVAEASAALRGFKGLSNVDETQLAEARRLASVIKDGKSELTARADRAAELAALADVEEETPAAPVVETPAPVVEATVETPAAAAPAAEVVAPRAAEVLAAGGGDTAPTAAKADRARLGAAPDAVGVAQGHVFADFEDAARSILARTAGYPQGPTATQARFQHGALQIARTFAPELVASGYEDDKVLDRAASFDRIGGEASLLASGGWVAASETIYDLLEYEGVDGMIDVPEVQIVRGGLRFTKGPSYAGFRGQGFSQTEAQAIAGTPKTFYRVPGTNFQEVRAGVVGLGVTAGILVQKAYPELVARVLRGLLVAHTHDVNKTTIAQIETGSTAVSNNLTAGYGALVGLLSSLELNVLDIRTTYGMTENNVLEVALPWWAKAVLRQDLASRWNANADRIPDEAITQHFADRGVRVQFVKDWQDSWIGQAGAQAVAWPTTVKYLIYPAGTWVRGLGDVITIETLYDSVGLGNNDYTALFTEESLLTVMRGFESRVVSVPLSPDGTQTGRLLTHTV